MKLAAVLAIFAGCLVFITLADQTSTAPRIPDRYQPQVRQLESSFESSAAEANLGLDAKVSDNWRQEMLDDVNALRRDAGRPLLTMANDLNRMSQEHSDYQASIKTMTHDDSSGSLGKRATDAGIKWSGLAENVAKGAETVDNVINQWKNSPLHLANMLGNFQQVGFGLATDGEGTKGSTYWTQTFVRP
ncbi:hypothetical protein GGI20_000624 [Coemansia sp. BCRC 34301]|nr:hypothetical protein GGI20_000624 [Coemansia sp. BCRC 34301]